MSKINYDIWGAPETWSPWSDSPTSNAIWGTVRNGASNYTNSDFTEYPPNKVGGSYKTLKEYYTNGKIAINSAIDDSLAYTAIANPDLPQCNVGIFCKGHISKENPIATLEKSNPVPFSLAYWNDFNISGLNPCKRQVIYGFDGFPNNATIIGSQSLQRWSPYASQQSTNETYFGTYNPNGYLIPVLSFGVKSAIYEINVRYIDSGTTAATSTLKVYLNHSDSWLQSHKLIGAYLIPHYRVATNGTYSASTPVGVTIKDRVNGAMPVFYVPYKTGGSLIYNYTSSQDRNSGCLPIYGKCSRDSFDTSVTIPSQLYDNPSSTNVGSYIKIYGYDRGDIFATESGNNAVMYITLDMSDSANVEYIMRGAAAYGLFFCTDIGALGNSGRDADRWVDDDMYLGVIRADGMTYGEYTHGLDNAEQPQYGWKDSTETPYVPGQNTNIYSQQTRIKPVGHIETMTKRYVLDENAVKAMSADLFAILSDLTLGHTDWSELISKSIDAFLVQNPIDCIVSLKKYPVKSIPKEGTLVNIQYGRYASGSAAAYECTADVYTYAFTPREIQPRFGHSFLDYEPYTSAELFIPYCGTVGLRMCDILGKILQPFLCVDYHTGQCTGFVLCDGIVIETVQGTIAVDVPVTGIQTATVEGQLMNAANTARSARYAQTVNALKTGAKLTAGIAGSAVNPLGLLALGKTAMSAAVNMPLEEFGVRQSDYDLTHTEAPQHIIGTSSSACGWIIDSDTARLILYYPGGGVIDDDLPPNFDAAALAEFIALNGVATVETGQIRSYPGITVGCKPMLDSMTTENGVPATAQELKLIEAAIAEGVIVPIS